MNKLPKEQSFYLVKLFKGMNYERALCFKPYKNSNLCFKFKDGSWFDINIVYRFRKV